MGNKYFAGKVSNKKVSTDYDTNFIDLINSLDKKIEEKMDKLEVSSSIDEIFNVLRASNKYIDETTPWILAKDDSKKDMLETVIYNLLESIRVCAVLLKPYLPNTSNEILKQINNNTDSLNYLNDNSYVLGDASPLFKRIDNN